MISSIIALVVYRLTRLIEFSSTSTIAGELVGSACMTSACQQVSQATAKPCIQCMVGACLLASTVTPQMRLTGLVTLLIKKTLVK